VNIDRRQPLTQAQKASLSDWVSRFTAISDPDFERLSERQALDFADLADRAASFGENGGRCFDRGVYTPAESKKFVGLLERLGSLQPGHYEKAEEEARMLAEFAEIARRSKMPGPRLVEDRPGDLRLPRAFWEYLFRPGQMPRLRVATVGELVVLMGCFANAHPPEYSRFECKGADLVLVVDTWLGLPMFNDVPKWRTRLDFLVRAGWFVIESEAGRELRLRLGRRGLVALGYPVEKTAKAKARA
jgi:hypothetical protein